VKRVRAGGGPQFDEIIMAIRRAVRLGHDVEAQAVILLARGQVPKTSSGKLQRFACREAYLTGSLEETARWEKS
jgi:acyl-CoA synthetase (AMP-forming)/AMP-acid ligase II